MIKRTESEATRRSKNLARSKKLSRRKRRLIMEGLESRQLLAFTPIDFPLPDVDPTLFDPQEPRNIGTVQALAFNEFETAIQSGLNDSIFSANFVPLGTGPGQTEMVDITGTMDVTVSSQGNIRTDVDTYAFDLRAGDILDVGIIGSGANVTILYESGRIWWGVDADNIFPLPDTGVNYPDASPLMTDSNALGAQVVPETGRYYLSVAPSASATLNYTVGLRVYRPALEQTPIGAQQVIFLDFDGGIYPTSDFPQAGLPLGTVRILGIEDSLDVLGFVNPNPSDAEAVILATVAEVEQQLATLATNGANGDYDSTGVPGQYGITVLNSLMHRDPGDHPLVTRIVIGSEFGTGFTDFGIAQSIDVGNFEPGEKVLALFEANTDQGGSYPISPTSSLAQAVAQQLAGTITHEAGHSFGIYHTDGNNTVENLMDEGSASLDDYIQGIGNDGIFGTSDDVTPAFNDDRFAASEDLFFGVERVPAALSFALSTGTVGGSISGRVFNDIDANGRLNGLDTGLAGVTVYADTNNNGVQDPTDPTDVTGADGSFSFASAPGNFNVFALTPPQFAPTTDTTQVNGQDSLEFGFTQVVPDITGRKFADLDDDGEFDFGEPGIAGVYIYLDLDGDDRPDLGEPAAITEADGTYTINFPGPGTYTLREVVKPGFVQTFPGAASNFEHPVVFNGIALTENYNFGNRPSRDFGDAPDSYSTLLGSGGPSHGITDGLFLGSGIPDAEIDGQPTILADGDDNTGDDDEDSLIQLDPLGPGASADFRITATNTTGTRAFLQAWADFDADGVFEASERIATDLELVNGPNIVTAFVPPTAAIGDTFVRLRYSQTAGLGVGGDADTGEVEDHRVTILEEAELAINDTFSVSRNTQANNLPVLDNDFDLPGNRLTIIGLDAGQTPGTVRRAPDNRSVTYSPPTGFVGRVEFGYLVENEFGQQDTARVVVNVTFQSNNPIAVDDTFVVPPGSVNRALNVLANDVPSTAGGLSIASVPPQGDQGGTLELVGGAQSIRYTPFPGFTGTEQFMYSIQDAAGSVSMAQVTINVGGREDDLVDFSIGVFDVLNDREITDVQVGETVNVRIFVDDLRYDQINQPPFGDLEGVAAAFLDLLYTDELLVPIDFSFGEFFVGGLQVSDLQTPGLLDEIGGVQPIDNLREQIDSQPMELLTVTMQAVSPGVAIFQADPADGIRSETILLGQPPDGDRALLVNELRLGDAELTILAPSANFPSAIDDSFPDGRDSNGNPILRNGSAARLDVLDNDSLGAGLSEFFVLEAPGLGDATVNNNGTAALEDDFIEYVADLNANSEGFQTFSYGFVTVDGIRSTAEVTLAFGNAGNDDLVGIELGLVSPNADGSVRVGDRIGIQVILEDLRAPIDETYVFAGFLDLMYDSGILSPSTIAGGAFDFDVTFELDFNENAAVGSAARDGIIDEFGTQLVLSVAESGNVDNPNLMATLFFDVNRAGTTRISGGPADVSPFQDTLLYLEDDPVPVNQIRYDVLNINVTGPAFEVLHNSSMPGDVNNDGDVSPIDALLVINHLGRQSVAESEDVTSARTYFDVSGDGKASSLDALLVINSLSREQLARESELVVANVSQLGSAGSGSSSSESDAVFADLNDSNLVGDAGASANNATAVVISPVDAGGSSNSDDDDDDVLGLLADDVAGLWS